MARGYSGSGKEQLEKQFRGFMATHREAVRGGAEAYEFDIKMRRIVVPDIVRRVTSEDDISTRVNDEQGDRLLYFAEEMKEAYPWISKWGQEGRSGGWLFFTTDEPVLDDNWQIPGRATPDDDPQDWNPTNLKPAEQRLDDLIKIESLLKLEKRRLEKDFADPAWWGIGPHDWMPEKKPKMGGIFDFMKKKPSEKQELIRIAPVDVIPSGGLIPAGPPAGIFANPFEILAPPSSARGVVPFIPPKSQPMFDVLDPAAPAARPVAHLEPVWQPPPRPAPSREPRPRTAWSLPTSDELAVHLRSILGLSRIFSQIRAARKAPDFRRNLDRWAAQGLPALIPVLPVATRDVDLDFARFFGIPSSVLDAYALQGEEAVWNGLFWPLFDLLSEAFEIEKPGDLPGWFAMEHDPDTDEWWLVYLEAE